MRTMSATTQLAVTFAITAAAVLAAFALPMPAQAVTITIGGDGERVSGSGTMVDVQRKLPAFSAIRLDSSVDVVAHPGPNPGVTIHADDNIVPLIETVVDGDTLEVRMRKGVSFYTTHDMKVEVEFSALTGTSQHGSGDLHITSLTGQRLESTIAGSGDLTIDNAQLANFALRVSGSGDVRIAGHADSARYVIAGSGDLRANDFATRHAEVNISGSGDAQVDVTDTLDARVAGSGDVRYRGHPHDVNRHVAGSGSVESAD